MMSAPRTGGDVIQRSTAPETHGSMLRPGLLKVVVTGSRHWWNYRLVCDNLDQFTIGELHEGGAAGADRCAKAWARSRQVTNFQHRARWDLFGARAGPLRNQAMFDEVRPGLIVAFKDDLGDNPNGGTEYMVRLGLKAGTPVWHVDTLGARWLKSL